LGDASESRRPGLRDAIVAVAVAAAAAFAFDAGVSVARGWSPPLDYVLFCLGLTALCALVIGLVFGWGPRRVELALAAWVGCAIPLDIFMFAPRSLWFAALVAGASLLALELRDRQRTRPVSAGLAVGLAFSFSAVILPRLSGFLGFARPTKWPYSLMLIAALGGILAGHSLYTRLRATTPRLPSESLISALLLAAMVALVPLALTGASTDQRVAPATQASSGLATAGEAPPSIVVLVLDTVRADRLSLYGYERDTTPNLRRFVEDHQRAVVFPLAISPSSWTLPAHASLFTGELPSSHGAHAGRLLDLRHTLSPDDGLIARTTLAEVLRERGYATAAILANAQITYFNGMDRGFDQVVVPRSPGKLSLLGEALRARFAPWAFAHLIKAYPPASAVNHEIIRYLESCENMQCFLLGNYMEAHWPFAARPPYRGRFSDPERGRSRQTDRYDEEILALDAALAELLEQLEERGILDRIWLVITADHGESFGEHGTEGHGTNVFNEEVRIPLLIHPPLGAYVTRHDAAVSLIDVTATLSALAGAAPLGRGRDLRAEIDLAPVQIELYGDVRLTMAERTPSRAVVLGHAKLIDRSGVTELYHLREDSEERHDQASAAPEAVSDLVHFLPPLTQSQVQDGAPGREATVEEIERLRALGYVQ